MTEKREIQFDCREVSSLADELQTAASDVGGNIVSAYEELMHQVSLSWKGESARLYLEKAESLKAEILDDAGELMRLAEQLKEGNRLSAEEER